ncbi:hypothetical protein PLESTB_001486700 [Pleodorina starrii]|uniref:Uncharacterized protein n=1 Tax=Pleodorina starrii TaxID=330485 RepID=A0A9W6BX16_9CHLO|nr:hypothetical protein PLESTB_001486700 [Pleodorina starrii]
MRHAGNSGLALLQVALTRLPIVSYHFTALYLYITSYAVFVWIYGEVSGNWRYGLNWETVRGVASHVGLTVLVFLVFLIMYGVALLREILGRRWVSRAGYWEFELDAAPPAPGRPESAEAVMRGAPPQCMRNDALAIEAAAGPSSTK